MHEPSGLAAPNGEIIGACRAQFRDIWPGEPGFHSPFVALGRQGVVDALLFLTTAHNSLSQRLMTELAERGHDIRVCVAANGEAMIAAAAHEAPELIIAPMLKIAIPDEVWTRHLCLIVHPGIKGIVVLPRWTGPLPKARKSGA